MSHELSETFITPVSDTSIIRPTLSQGAKDFAVASRATNTIRAYQSDTKSFVAFCDSHGKLSLPASPETIADYISWLAASKKPSTISRHLASISVLHKMGGHPSPTSSEIVRLTMAGIRRTIGTAQTQKAPLRIREIRAIVADIGIDRRAIRDRAILLVCYAGAFRRSEIVSLNAADIAFVEEGVILTLRHSKTDQDRQGVEVAIMRGSTESTCPVRALQEWIVSAGILDGPVFRPIIGHDLVAENRLAAQGVARILKRLSKGVGLEEKNIGGHSTRAGMITDAFAAGVAQAIVARHSRHRSNAINAYVREDKFKQNPSGMIGL